VSNGILLNRLILLWMSLY